MSRLEIIDLRLAGTTPLRLVAGIQRVIAADGKGPTAHISYEIFAGY